jgi:hypothetical protein
MVPVVALLSRKCKTLNLNPCTDAFAILGCIYLLYQICIQEGGIGFAWKWQGRGDPNNVYICE